MIGNIYISGQIGTFDGATGVELIDVISQVKKQPEALSFNVHINSEGGLVDVGFDIYEYLISLGKPITTIGSGIVASIATVIFMSGTIRQVRENTPFMIHLPWGGSMGTADELEQFAEELRTIEKKMVGFYKKVLDLEEAAIIPLLKNETWLTPDQLTGLGFTTSAPVMAVAKTALKKVNINNNDKMNLTDKDLNAFEKMFEKVLGKFKKKEILNKIVQDANGASIDFTDLPDDGVIEVGQMATIDGSPAEGEHVMPDGFTYVFVAGELTEIKPAVEESELDVANARIAELESELEQSIATTVAAEQKVTDIQNDVVALKKQVMSKFKIDNKKEPKPDEDKLSGMKEYLNKKK